MIQEKKVEMRMKDEKWRGNSELVRLVVLILAVCSTGSDWVYADI